MRKKEREKGKRREEEGEGRAERVGLAAGDAHECLPISAGLCATAPQRWSVTGPIIARRYCVQVCPLLFRYGRFGPAQSRPPIFREGAGVHVCGPC